MSITVDEIRAQNVAHRSRVHRALRDAGFDTNQFPLSYLGAEADLVENLVLEGRGKNGVFSGITLEQAEKIVAQATLSTRWRVEDAETGEILEGVHTGSNAYWRLAERVRVYDESVKDLVRTDEADRVVILSIN